MSQPASKRRRLSDDDAEYDLRPNSLPQSAPATPRRASYLSPTKSSLQRSHPHLLQRSNRPPVQLQGHRLLQHVLSGATPEETQLSKARIQPGATPVERPALPRLNGYSQGSASSVPSSSQSQSKPALQRRRQHTRSISKQLEDELSSGYTTVPRLVEGSQSRRRQFSLSPDEGDHALPPTSVQLGRDPPPERPRGLASSSPRGSRSGSERSRKGLRDSQSITSSPLKPKSPLSRAQAMAERDRQVQLDDDDSPESDVAEGDIQHDAEIEEPPALIKDRELILKELQTSTRKLLSYTRGLEKAVEHNDVLKSLNQASGLKGLITTAGMTRTLQEPLFDLKPTPLSPSKQALHLNLFAPGGLRLTASTNTGMTGEHTTITHTVRVAVPPPWPPHIFCAVFEARTHPEDLTVDSISYVAAAGRQTLSQELHQWIKARLANNIVRTDFSGVVWGLGIYFEAAVERAKVFHALNRKYGEDQSSPTEPDFQKLDDLSVDHALVLSQYISTTSLTLPMAETRKAPSSHKLLASWQISLTPTSEARHKCEILLSGVAEPVASAAAALFDKLWKIEGYERSVDAIWGLVVDGENSMDGAGAGGSARGTVGRKKKKKRKKFA